MVAVNDVVHAINLCNNQWSVLDENWFTRKCVLYPLWHVLQRELQGLLHVNLKLGWMDVLDWKCNVSGELHAQSIGTVELVNDCVTQIRNLRVRRQHVQVRDERLVVVVPQRRHGVVKVLVHFSRWFNFVYLSIPKVGVVNFCKNLLAFHVLFPSLLLTFFYLLNILQHGKYH